MQLSHGPQQVLTNTALHWMRHTHYSMLVLRIEAFGRLHAANVNLL
jgi:hypothetical protein